MVVTNDSTNDPVRGLVGIGFGEYEARAYVELLRGSPVTAYELSKSSGIPSSKIYETLAKLQERGAALPVEEGGKLRYVPLSPVELVGAQRVSIEGQLENLEDSLGALGRDQRLSYVWNLRNYRELMGQVKLLIQDARRELIVSGWYEDIAPHEQSLIAMEQRNVRVAVVLFGPGHLKVGHVYHHPIEDTLYAERGGRALNLVADGARALVGTMFSDGNVEGAWSMNRGFVLLAEDYIKHDVYIMKIVSRMDATLTETFGERYQFLRDIFTDRDTGANTVTGTKKHETNAAMEAEHDDLA